MKKFLVAILVAVMLITSIPSEARGGSFGGGGRSSFSSARSSSSFSAPAPRASAPSAPMARPTGGVSSGGNVGMQRPAVTNAARNPTPTYNSSPSYGSGNRGSYGSSNNQSYSSHTTVVHHYSPNTGGGSFGMGSIAMAAMGGYMLGGIMHDSHGAVYNGAGYTNGVPTQGGQYYTQPQVGDVQQQVQVAQPQVVYVQQSNGFVTFLGWLFGISFIVLVIALIRRIFI